MPAFHANLAEAYRALGQWERAIGCCCTALRLAPDYAEAHNNLGLAVKGLGRHAEAVEHFRRALELQPEFASVHNNLGIALRELKQFAEALRHFRRAVELAPEFAPGQTNLGQMLLDQGQPQEALPHCREAVRLQPDVAALHHNLGNALRSLKQFADARAAFLEALRLDPNLAHGACPTWDWCCSKKAGLARRLVWLKQATELEPNNADFWEYLAELQGEREENAEAMACWERVLALDPDRATAHVGLSWAPARRRRAAWAAEHCRIAAAA